MTKKYRDITFSVDQLPGCCGIGVAYSFAEQPAIDYQHWGYKGVAVAPKYSTEREQAEAAYEEIINTLFMDNQYTTGYITLVSKYRDEGPRSDPEYMKNGDGTLKRQFPALQDLLVKKGWDVNHQFINPNHGNEITVFSIHFPHLVDEFGEQFDREDGYNEDYDYDDNYIDN